VVGNPGAVETELVEVLPALHQRCPGSILKGRNAETKLRFVFSYSDISASICRWSLILPSCRIGLSLSILCQCSTNSPSTIQRHNTVSPSATPCSGRSSKSCAYPDDLALGRILVLRPGSRSAPETIRARRASVPPIR
jgi:hypothetical protein